MRPRVPAGKATNSPGGPVSTLQEAVAHHPSRRWQRDPPDDSARRALICVPKPRALWRAPGLEPVDTTGKETKNPGCSAFEPPREPLGTHLPRRAQFRPRRPPPRLCAGRRRRRGACWESWSESASRTARSELHFPQFPPRRPLACRKLWEPAAVGVRGGRCSRRP